MSIVLSPRIERRLIAEASLRGVPPERLADQLIDAALPPSPGLPPNQSSIDILDQWQSQTKTDDPVELQHRQVEFEQFSTEMNATRIATDGPDARIPFP
jgi:hypothetical protein